MDASSWNSSRWVAVVAAIAGVLMCPGCAFFKYHGRAAANQTGHAVSTNRYESSISNQAQKTANTNAAPSKAVDNTAQNKTEAQQDTLTPMDQGDSDQDRQITQQLRREIMTGKDGHPFSFNAKNIKIITVNTEMTLRGVVANPTEKARIDALAHKVPGVTKVFNQLEVKGSKGGSSS